jgi:alanine dehydrogenase
MSTQLTLADASQGIHCSFCGQTPDEGSLVTAPEIAICGTCVSRCADLLSATDGDRYPATGEPVEDVADARVRVRLLGEADVAMLVSMDDAIDTMKAVLPRFSAGEVAQPVRLVMPLGPDRGFLGLMPAALDEPETVGAKLVAFVPGNADLGLPTHSATIILLNPRTGVVSSILDGRFITEVRTAAVSALSAALLAREAAAVLAIVGSGVQARSHLEALERVWTFSEVHVWSPTPEHLAAFVETMERIADAPIVPCGSAKEAVRGADVIVLATASPDPVIEDGWVADGAHVISVGACRPDQREMDPALVARSRVYVDSRAAALVESGDIVMGIAEGRFPASHIVGEIGELIAGRIEGRRSAHEVTLFKSLGLAVEDVAMAELAYQRAVQQDRGTEIEL